MKLSPEQLTALDQSISADRLSTYSRAADADPDRARRLYLWDRELSVAFFADLATLEVALRNAMNEQLTARWGPEWYSDRSVPLDDRTSRQLAGAWKQIGGERTPGRVVAQCTLGFWRGLLDKGDHSGHAPRRVRCDYEMIWRGVLSKAFPGGRAQARADGERWQRTYALAVVSRVNALRNRIAHHEPLIAGVPLPGTGERRSAFQAHEDCLRLAAMIDRNLHSIVETASAVPGILAARPL